MTIDLIEYYMYCNTVPLNICISDKEPKCKYDWYCTKRRILIYATMIYSEGE